MANETTTSVVAAGLDTWYDKVLLKRAKENLVHERFGQMRPLSMNSGTTAKFRRYNKPAAVTAEITEGEDPAPTLMSITDITCTLGQYGGYFKITDKVDMTNQDPVLSEAATLAGEWAADSLDKICRSVLIAGTSVRYANAAASRDAVVSKITKTDLDVAIRTLENNNATKPTKVIAASTGYGTSSVRPAFWAFVHPYVAFDLDNSITGYTAVSDYASQKDIQEGEIGCYKNIRFIASTNAYMIADSGGAVGATGLASTSGSNIDIYATIIVADNAYGKVPLKGQYLRNIRKGFKESGSALELYCTSGWKSMVTYKILNDNFMTRIESGVTA